MNDPFARLATFAVRRRWLVLIFWVVLLGVGVALSPLATKKTQGGGFSVPGSDSDKAASILSTQFNSSTFNNVTVVFYSKTQSAYDPAFRATVTAAVKRLHTVKGVKSIFDYYENALPALVSKDGHTTIVPISLNGNEGQVEDIVPLLRDQLKGVTVEHYVTGYPAVNKDTLKTSADDLTRAERFTVPIVLILLLFVFRTVVSALLPFVGGLASLVLSTAVLGVLASMFDVSTFALNVASILGLGLSIDYSLLIVTRLREERDRGLSPHDAIIAAMTTAGRSVTYSGIMVVLAMVIMSSVINNLMIIRSISIGVALVAIVAVFASLTLLPAVLAFLGDNIERWRILPRRAVHSSYKDSIWYRLSHRVMRRPFAWLLASLVLLLALAYPAHDIKLVGGTTGVLPPSDESVQGAKLMTSEFASNELTPIQIVMQTSKNGIWDPKFLDAIKRLSNVLQADPRVARVDSLSTFLPYTADYQYNEMHSNYFQPADKVLIEASTHPGTLPHPAGTSFTTMINMPVAALPWAPAYIGFGRFTMKAGSTHGPTVSNDIHLISLSSGALRIQLTGKATMTHGWIGNTGKANPVQPAPSGPFTLNVGDQLLIPNGTAAKMTAMGSAPVAFYGVAIYTVRSTPGPFTTWAPTRDFFDGISRIDMAGSVAERMPTGAAVIETDLGVMGPYRFLPKHYHPGPELIDVESGVFNVYMSSLMTVTNTKGQDMETVPYDHPIPLHPGDRALVQMYGVHRAYNLTNKPASIFSTRIEAAGQPLFGIVAPRQAAVQYMNMDGNSDTAVITVIPKTSEYTDQHEGLVYDLRQNIIPEIPQLAPYKVYVGGDAASFLDFKDGLYNRLPLVIALVMLMIFVILMMFFQSIWLPIKAMILSLLSILATFGVLTVIFQHGVGTSLLGFKSQGMVNVITPAILYVVLFSLSTDYEVFLLSRVREYFLETGDNVEAVAAGLGSTGRVVTAAGLILIGTFGSFATGEIVTLKEIGLGLAIGVLLDATVVRIIMVPATMKLLGNGNWWMPAGLKRFVPELREGPSGVASHASPRRDEPSSSVAMSGVGPGGKVGGK
jgi:uncharacterized membrane protein YdfJ with MMPL/SSD domain